MRFRHNGFSLVELMIGVAILLVVISACVLTFVHCMLLNQSSVNMTKAVNDAQYVLEQMRAKSFSDLSTYSPPTFTNLLNESVPAPTITPVGSSLKQVTVNVNWTERQVARSLSLTTYFAQ